MRFVYEPSDHFDPPPPPDRLIAARAARELRLYFQSPRYRLELERQLGEFGHASNVAAITERVGSAGRFPRADRELRPA